ncbi:hypothetical protein SXCC_00558 [Gluconacetobacter sp. SXCC-1]|nr:hypothetical protein SXCC_00558 [Gluconacetobacter sp. SXCC-1]
MASPDRLLMRKIASTSTMMVDVDCYQSFLSRKKSTIYGLI